MAVQPQAPRVNIAVQMSAAFDVKAPSFDRMTAAVDLEAPR
jgi:hypothetical protein